MSDNQKGFTLIELIVVIVILGVLAATALPKFVDLSGDARAAIMNGVEGSMRGANTIIFARSAIEGETGQVSASVTIGGVAIATVYGYAEDWLDLRAAMDLEPAADFTDIAAGDGGVSHTDAAAAATCQILYTNPTAVNLPPTYAPTITDCS